MPVGMTERANQSGIRGDGWRRPALITGASAGIVRELSALFAADGHDVVLVARGVAKLEAPAAEIGAAHGVAAHVVGADLGDAGAPAAIFERVRGLGLEVDFLANNAGFGSSGPFIELDFGVRWSFPATAESAPGPAPAPTRAGRPDARQRPAETRSEYLTLTGLDVDAIVNAANASPLGGGVDGANHAAAGRELLAAGRALGGARTGEVKLTPGFRLPARFVLHAVGPVWQGGGRGEDGQLASCYREAMRLADEQGVKTVAFSAIATGISRFPIERAARVAVAEVVRELGARPGVERAIFCARSSGDREAYERVSGELAA
jgi:O-acetyl-ADP-ribose deacetylase (regulator of RNase III)